MKTVTVIGWKPGFLKVQFTKFLRNEFGYSLSDAKLATDKVLEDGQLELRAPDSEVARLLKRLNELGVQTVNGRPQDASSDGCATGELLRPSA